MQVNLLNDLFPNRLFAQTRPTFNLANRIASYAQDKVQTNVSATGLPTSTLELLEKRLSAAFTGEQSTQNYIRANEVEGAQRGHQLIDRVLSDARQLLSQSDTDIDDVRSKIEQGFRETYEALENLQQLDDSAKVELTSLYKHIQQGLNTLSSDVSDRDGEHDDVDDDDGIGAGELTLNSVSHTASIDIQRSLSSTLQIQTAEGDIVNIQLSRNSSAQFDQAYQADANGFSFSSNRSVSAEFNLEYSVEGELNENENAAIKDLIKDVNILASKAYDGNLQNALKKAAGLSSFYEEINSFDLQLSYEQSITAQSQTEISFSGREISPELIDNVINKLSTDSPADSLFNNINHFAKDVYDINIINRFNEDSYVKTLDDDTKADLQANLGVDDQKTVADAE